VQEALFEVELRPERRYYRQILHALTGALVDGDQLRAEVAVSRVLGVIWASDPARDGGAEEAFGRGLVDYVRQQHGQPVAANLLRLLAATATVREVREAAATALDVRPWPAAHWEPAIGGVVVGRCWVVEDAFGDHATILCEFGYGPMRHGIAVHVDRIAQGAAVDVTLVDDVDAAELELRLGADHARDEFRRVEPGWAGAVLEQALARTDLLPETPVAPGFAPLRALALARVRSLPVSNLALVNGPAMSYWPASGGPPDVPAGRRTCRRASARRSPASSAGARRRPRCPLWTRLTWPVWPGYSSTSLSGSIRATCCGSARAASRHSSSTGYPRRCVRGRPGRSLRQPCRRSSGPGRPGPRGRAGRHY
jgi:hypothetical protein